MYSGAYLAGPQHIRAALGACFLPRGVDQRREQLLVAFFLFYFLQAAEPVSGTKDTTRLDIQRDHGHQEGLDTQRNQTPRETRHPEKLDTQRGQIDRDQTPKETKNQETLDIHASCQQQQKKDGRGGWYQCECTQPTAGSAPETQPRCCSYARSTCFPSQTTRRAVCSHLVVVVPPYAPRQYHNVRT
eukprot:2147199-Rhodomonas_salina.2